MASSFRVRVFRPSDAEAVRDMVKVGLLSYRAGQPAALQAAYDDYVANALVSDLASIEQTYNVAEDSGVLLC